MFVFYFLSFIRAMNSTYIKIKTFFFTLGDDMKWKFKLLNEDEGMVWQNQLIHFYEWVSPFKLGQLNPVFFRVSYTNGKESTGNEINWYKKNSFWSIRMKYF